MATAWRLEDLDVWHLAVELRDEIHKLTETGAASRNFKFRDQIRDSSSSPARNIAEGFGRYKPKSFAYFLSVALGSLQETRTHLLDGRTKNYFTEADTNRLLRLQARTTRAAKSLRQYLDSCNNDGPARSDQQ